VVFETLLKEEGLDEVGRFVVGGGFFDWRVRRIVLVRWMMAERGALSGLHAWGDHLGCGAHRGSGQQSR
jgi:hypothetical protein